jgi:hypothetical protein
MDQKLNDPLQTVLNGAMIVFEKYGDRIQKIDDGEAEKTLTLENGSICSVFEANNNLLGVIYQKEEYKTSLLLVDKAFTAVFERAYSEAFVADALFIGKTKICILLNTCSDEEIRSYIEIADINSVEVVNTKDLGDSLFLKVYDLKGDRFAVMSGREMYIFDGGFNEITHKTLGEGEIIYDVCQTREGILVLIGEEMTGYDSLMKAKRIEFYDTSGETIYSIPSDSRLERIEYTDGKIVGISSSDIFVYSTDGEILYNTESDDIIEKIIEYKGGYYFFHIDRIEKVIP